MTSPLTPVSANGSAGTGGAGPQPGPVPYRGPFPNFSDPTMAQVMADEARSHAPSMAVSTDISTAETAESRDGTRRGGSVNA